MSELTSARGKLMLGYLPTYYETSRVIKTLLQAEGSEFDQVRLAFDQVLDQFFVGTATWGLSRWEEELGLAPAMGQPDAERRDRIISRLRGVGTATISVVRRVAESYEHGSVDVLEDHAAYTVTLRFVDTAGIPPALGDLQAAIRAVLPAHLDVKYEFNYLTWDELDAQLWDWDALDALDLTWDALEVYR